MALYDSVFTPWFGLVALVLAIVLFRYIWQGDLASIGKRGMWALAGLWFASATYLTPLVYTHALDDVLIGLKPELAARRVTVEVGGEGAMPAVTADDVTVELRPGKLRFWAELRSAGPREYLVHEWEYGGYEREVDIPEGFGSSLEATLANGQLAVRVLRGDPAGSLVVKPTAI